MSWYPQSNLGMKNSHWVRWFSRSKHGISCWMGNNSITRRLKKPRFVGAIFQGWREMGGAGSIWCSSGMIISPLRNFWRDEKISEWNWSKKWAWMSTKRMAWNFAYFNCPWILDNILVSPSGDGSCHLFPLGMGGCHLEWFGSIALFAIWRTQFTATPKKTVGGCRLLTGSAPGTRHPLKPVLCSSWTVLLGDVLGPWTVFFFSRCFLDGWWCFWWNQDSGVVRKTSACPPTIPFPGLVDMFSKVFVDAQVFGRIQMAFRDLCIYLHTCFFFLKMEFAEIICKIDLTSFSLQFLGYHPFLTHSHTWAAQNQKQLQDRSFDWAPVLVHDMGYEVASLMEVRWEKPMELPWSNMEHGGYEVMARVVVGCCWWGLSRSMEAKLGLWGPQLRDWWRDADDDKILIKVDQVTSRWLQEGFRLCPERCPLPRAKACWEC